MSEYQPPVKDMSFLLHDVLGFTHDDLDRETVEAVLEEASKLSRDVLAPLNWTGDQDGATLENGVVTTAKGFKEAYAQYCEGGWNAVPFDPEYGGQGLPWALAFPIQEMWQGANMSFGLCPLLNQGAVEAILSHGSDEQKKYYLPKLISGEWTGTMNLTEAQAGSDLGLIRSKADKQEDGTYKISGQKIYITYGEHDFTDNIIHLVLARTADAPADVKGISLFIVPKFMKDGTRNDLKCTGLEHKLGIHASPTCTMQFGDEGGATGYLIGKEHHGLKYMFTMMNNARLSVGLQGVAIAERAYQHALRYANDRIQGKSFETNERITISHHADIRRMLMSMKSQVEAGRALTYDAAIALDKAAIGDDNAKAKVDLLTPLVKSWCTDMACEVASTGIQIHGGMGFVEETGAAQYYRDARILPIYEGTNGIQAADLVFRKILRDGGESALKIISQYKDQIPEGYKAIFKPYFELVERVIDKILLYGENKDLDSIAATSAPLLKGLSIVLAGTLLTRAETIAKNSDNACAQEKQKITEFFVYHILPTGQSALITALNATRGI